MEPRCSGNTNVKLLPAMTKDDRAAAATGGVRAAGWRRRISTPTQHAVPTAAAD
jgi:hypothetical protein